MFSRGPAPRRPSKPVNPKVVGFVNDKPVGHSEGPFTDWLNSAPKYEPLTDAERDIVDMLANAYNAFCHLPVEHPMDQDEFCRAIHVLQDKVLARPGRREMNAGRVG